jgi:hypothetical protein
LSQYQLWSYTELNLNFSITFAVLYADQSLTAQTAYAQLLEATLARSFARRTEGVAALNGSFVAKTVKGRAYWYYQFTGLDQRSVQLYVGPDSGPVRALIERARGAVRQDSPVTALAASAAVLGNSTMLPRHFRVLRTLADFGFFEAGGVLAGTHAFAAYANMLGVRWGASQQTHDLDFAHAGKHLSLALRADFCINLNDAITSLGMGFIPVEGLASYVAPKEPDFRIDFLTPKGRSAAPFKHKALGISLQPLPFMEFSLEVVEQSALFTRSDAVVVNVPAPERFALHKLIVAGERTGAWRTKAHKDVMQSAALIEVLRDQRPDALREAWADLHERGSGWRRRLNAGLTLLERAAPALQARQWFG